MLKKLRNALICALTLIIESKVKYITLHNRLLFIDSSFRKLVIRFSISSETSRKLKNS